MTGSVGDPPPLPPLMRMGEAAKILGGVSVEVMRRRVEEGFLLVNEEPFRLRSVKLQGEVRVLAEDVRAARTAIDEALR